MPATFATLNGSSPWPPPTRQAGLRELMGYILASFASVTALVGDQIYYAALPTDVATGITFQLISNRTPGDLDGPNATGRALIQLAAIGRDADEQEQITTALRDAIDGYEGQTLGWTIHDIALTDERDSWNSPTDGADVGTFRTTLDCYVLYTRT